INQVHLCQADQRKIYRCHKTFSCWRSSRTIFIYIAEFGDCQSLLIYRHVLDLDAGVEMEHSPLIGRPGIIAKDRSDIVACSVASPAASWHTKRRWIHGCIN